MKLQRKIWLSCGAVVAVVMAIDLGVGYRDVQASVHALASEDARIVQSLLMATRRIYHQQFLDSGIELNSHTIGFLPAHAMSKISADLPNWLKSGLRFNNVSDRPRNQNNAADAVELEDMAWFRANPKAKDRILDIQDASGKSFYHFAAPIWIEPYCLKCHGERSATPAAIRDTYDQAYGYKVGDLRGVLSIHVPTDELRASALQTWLERSVGRLVGYVALLLLLGLMLQHLVARRLTALGRAAKRLQTGELATRVDASGNDELSELSQGFNHMAEGLAKRDAAVHESMLQLRESESKYRSVLASSQDGFWLANAQGRLLEVNDAYVAMTGFSREELLQMSVAQLKADESRAQVQAELQAIMAGQAGLFETLHQRKDGQVLPVEISATFSWAEGGVFAAFVRDISKRQEADARIRQLNFFDGLTGLPNRVLFTDRATQALRQVQARGEAAALVCLDLDHFGHINDSLGHQAGDQMLVLLTERFHSLLGPDDLLARPGGDEFLFLLTHLDEAQAQAAVNSLIQGVAKPLRVMDKDIAMTVSVGVAIYPQDGPDVDALLRAADTANHSAKQAGLNSVRFFTAEMRQSVTLQLALEADLRDALVRHEFVLYYQAQVNDAGAVLGAEVLVRWQHPKRGLVPPADFIPLAEANGLILPLGQWVLETACWQLARWADVPALAGLTLAVNVSAKQFQLPDFVARVVAVLELTGINPQRLKLELTESLLVSDVQDTIDKMRALKKLGVQFSLDDFGTGYSSLAYLKRLPLDQLKIDQGFVRDILLDPDDAAIAHTIVVLARAMGLAVIAEGVETVAQRDRLLALGCQHFQGYLFSKPVPLADFEALAPTKNKKE
ncbi:MAG: EAL domain-containing protein [Rhodoferax sp.]|nr:EAL domain-containing protein [Rhodoferax sp.]